MADPVAVSTAFWDLKASEVIKFVAMVITALAWPLSTFFILRLFKGEILKLIPSLSKLKALGIEAEFNRGLAKAEAEVARISATSNATPPQSTPPAPPMPDSAPPPSGPTPPPAGPTPPTQPSPVTTQNAPPTTTVSADLVGSYSIEGPSEPDPIALHANPTGIVMVSWQMLEQALRRYAQTIGVPMEVLKTFTPGQLVAYMANNELLDNSEVNTLQGLIDLRNLAAHSSGRTISDAEAKRFNEVSRKLAVLYQTKAQQRIERKRVRAADM